MCFWNVKKLPCWMRTMKKIFVKKASDVWNENDEKIVKKTSDVLNENDEKNISEKSFRRAE